MHDDAIHKAVKWFSDEFIGAVRLDNDVMIFLRTDGSALGCDGRTYFVVSEDDENGDCVVLGYRVRDDRADGCAVDCSEGSLAKQSL